MGWFGRVLCSQQTEHSVSFHAERALQPLALQAVVLASSVWSVKYHQVKAIVDVLDGKFHLGLKLMASQTGKEDCDGQIWVSLLPYSQILT